MFFLKDSILNPNVLDAYYEALGGTGSYPYTVILDENGVIAYKLTGAMSYEQLKSAIDNLLQ